MKEEEKQYVFRRIGAEELSEIKALFFSVFTAEPWMDDWSDETQLDLYLRDLVCQHNSLTCGLYENGVLVGLSMGHIKHWYTGTEYYIDELCIQKEKQGKGLGSRFLREIERESRALGLTQLFLQTEANVPAYEFYKKNGFQELKGHVSFAKTIDLQSGDTE